MSVQRLIKTAIVGSTGILNLYGVWLSLRLSRHPAITTTVIALQNWLNTPLLSLPIIHINPIASPLALLHWLEHPAQITWLRLKWSTLLPWFTYLTPLSSARTAIALVLCILITTLCVALSTWLLTLDLPQYCVQQINLWRVRRARKQIWQLRQVLRKIDLLELPRREAAALEPIIEAIQSFSN